MFHLPLSCLRVLRKNNNKKKGKTGERKGRRREGGRGGRQEEGKRLRKKEGKKGRRKKGKKRKKGPWPGKIIRNWKKRGTMRTDKRFEKKQRDFTINQAVDRGSDTPPPTSPSR